MNYQKALLAALILIYSTGTASKVFGQEEKELKGNTWTFSKYYHDLHNGDTLTLYLAYEYGEFAFLTSGELDSCAGDTYCVRKTKELTAMVKTCKLIKTGSWTLKAKQLTIYIGEQEIVLAYLENTTNYYKFEVLSSRKH
jgi:hypothetical protein